MSKIDNVNTISIAENKEECIKMLNEIDNNFNKIGTTVNKITDKLESRIKKIEEYEQSSISLCKEFFTTNPLTYMEEEDYYNIIFTTLVLVSVNYLYSNFFTNYK